MAFLLCVANQKGGSGKTTTAVNLAGGFSRAKYPVLLIDADPQESAIAWSTAGSGLPFVVARGDLLAHGLQSLLDSTEYQVVIVDCPPGVADDGGPAGRIARAALLEADAILVPMKPVGIDLSSTSSMVAYLASIREQANPGQRVLVLLNEMRDTRLRRQGPSQALALFSELPHATVLSATVGLREAIAEVFSSGQTIFDYAPRSEAAREYSALTQEVLVCLSRPLLQSSAALAI